MCVIHRGTHPQAHLKPFTPTAGFMLLPQAALALLKDTMRNELQASESTATLRATTRLLQGLL